MECNFPRVYWGSVVMVQYNRSFSAPSSDVQAVFANKVDLLDKYVLCQTGEREYTGLIYDRASKETTQVVFFSLIRG